MKAMPTKKAKTKSREVLPDEHDDFDPNLEMTKIIIGGKTIFVDAEELEIAGLRYGSAVTFQATLAKYHNKGSETEVALRVPRANISDLGNFEELFSGFPVVITITPTDGGDEYVHIQNLSAFTQTDKGGALQKEFSLEFGKTFTPGLFFRSFSNEMRAEIKMYHEPIVCKLDDQVELPLDSPAKTDAENQAAIDTLAN
jgi:hypothetical protein